MFRRPIVPPDALRCLRLSVPSAHGRFAPDGAPWNTEGRGLLLFASLSPTRLFFLEWKRSDLPSSWGTPMYVPCSQTPAGPSRQALTARRCGLPLLAQRRLPRLRFFRGSITRPIHPLSTLRRMDHSTTTQDSLPAVASFAGQDASSCKVPTKGFSYPSHPPFLSFSWRKQNEPTAKFVRRCSQRRYGK